MEKNKQTNRQTRKHHLLLQGRSQHFWFVNIVGLSSEAYLLPFLLPFLPLLLLPRYRSPFISVFFPFLIASFSLQEFPVPTLNLAMSGERCGITSSQPWGQGYCTASQCFRGTVYNLVMLQFTWNLNLSDSDLTVTDLLTIKQRVKTTASHTDATQCFCGIFAGYNSKERGDAYSSLIWFDVAHIAQWAELYLDSICGS